MVIKRLLLAGSNKQNAVIQFTDGINIISGVSDTGKSYIYQCINYVLCSDTLPKDITEAQSYSKIILEISINNITYSISREKNSNKVCLYDCVYEEIDGSKIPEVLNVKHDDNKNNNLSKWLLNKIFGERSIKVLKKKDDPRGISFRDLIHFCCASEENIISTCSPFYTTEFVNQTTYKSVFNFLISGKDYSDTIKKDYKKEKANKEIYIEILNNQINSLKGNIKRINTSMIKKQKDVDLLNKTNEEIKFISEEISLLNKGISSENEKLNDCNVKLLELLSQYDSFNSLKSTYEIQLKETQIVNDFADVLEQMPKCKCPLCKQYLNVQSLEKQDIFNINQYNQSTHNKLLLLKNELEKTIDELNIKIKNQEKEIGKIKEKILKEQLKLDQKIKLLKEKNEEVLVLKQIELNFMKLDLYKENLEKLIDKREQIKNQEIKNTSKKHEEISDIDLYCSLLKSVIDSWTGTQNNINFDAKINDISINGKNRSAFGKGFRAFYSTAMIISLQRYLQNKNLSLPGFVVIDSPLVSLKEQKKLNKEDEIVDDFMQSNMIKDLIENSNLGQIIIFENKEFDKFKNDINYIYFSESKSDGFIPLN